ncbi:amidohydrolase family protein [Parenemella sanctibonifatiensis]|uniref:Amidohydrolase n=1 Tax=Parenemella sanctibonifatiensis TaxID=2016505 RepID=A0A255EJE9_9ACTN|nr:amidohydrolase family protein [Parenemella sanctibonifatiensis]OYN91360.1 amidohydrolase [Parenemella sanctibonifatiensis]
MVESLRIRGRLTDSGEPAALWLDGGRIGSEPVRGARDLPGQWWISPGLVDAHCHIGLAGGGRVDAATVKTQAETELAAGVTFLRDAGSPAPTAWVSGRTGMPTIIRAGRHIARPKRYLRHFGAEVQPEDLVAEVERQVANGDGWIKLVGDWIDREVGDLTPLWPIDIATAAIDRAHELGAKVTAHCFSEQSVQELVRAGLDCVEHGTGLDAETIELMASRSVALVPTMANLENFPDIAASGEAKFPTYAAHMRALFDSRLQVIGQAVEAGVQVYAGTDAGGVMPHGLIAREVELMASVMGAEAAVAAASWQARTWLGAPGLAAGDPADLVLYADDPRQDPRVLRDPAYVIVDGLVVAGSQLRW